MNASNSTLEPMLPTVKTIMTVAKNAASPEVHLRTMYGMATM
jgi:hypothetical protein